MPQIFVEEYAANGNKQKKQNTVMPNRVGSLIPIPKISDYVAPKSTVVPGRVESIIPIPKLNTYVPPATSSKPATPKATVAPVETGTQKVEAVPPATVVPVTRNTGITPQKGEMPQPDLLTAFQNRYTHMTPLANDPTKEAHQQLQQEQSRLYQAAGGAQTQQQSDIEARINALNQAKQELAVANLGKARDAQLSNLTGEEAGIKPMYYDKRNVTASTNMMGRRTVAEELAARGETNSGVADQANINANMSLQSETGTLNRQEAADITDIARRRTGVQNAYESDVVSAKANLEAVAMQNLIDQYNADRQFKLQEAGVTGTYSGNQTLDALNAYRNFALNEAGVTGSYNGNPTMQSQSQTFNQNMATQQYNQAVEQQNLDNLYRQQTFDYQKSRDAVGDSQWQQQMNLNLRQQSFSEAQQKIENAYQSRQISLSEKNQALQWAQYNAEQDPNSLDNQLKKANLDLNTYTKNTAALNDTIQRLDSLYTYKDADGVPTRNPNYTDAQIRNAIIGMNLSDDQTDTLLLRYGLQIN